MDKTEQRVWGYLLKNRQATALDVSLNCDATLGYAEELNLRLIALWNMILGDDDCG